VAIEDNNLADKSLIKWNAEPKQPVCQELQKLAVKRRHERIQSRIEHDGEIVMKTLEDSQSEQVHIDVLRETDLHHEETNEIVELAFEDIGSMRILNAGRKRTGSSH
jgi:hypothetical protein